MSLLSIGAACGGDGGDDGDGARTSEPPAGDADRSPEATAGDYVEASIDGDCERIQGLVTESFWTERGALTAEEAADDCPEDLERELTSPEDVTVEEVELTAENDSEAIVVVSGTDRGRDWATEMTVVHEDGAWRVHWTEPQ